MPDSGRFEPTNPVPLYAMRGRTSVPDHSYIISYRLGSYLNLRPSLGLAEGFGSGLGREQLNSVSEDARLLPHDSLVLALTQPSLFETRSSKHLQSSWAMLEDLTW